MTRASEDARFTWIAHWISDLAQDLRYAFRGMRRNTGFATFTILIAGLGIGASSAVFSVVNAVLLRPLPFRDPGRLIWMSNGNEATSTQTEHYSDLRALNRSFSDLAAFADWGVGNRQLLGSGEPDRLTSVPVTANFFTLLGVQPAIGRWFTAEECRGKYSAPPAMLLSYSFWQRRFASDPSIVGRKLTLDSQPVIVVGVLPKSVRLRQYLYTRHTNGHLRSLAFLGPQQAARKHDADRWPLEARRHDSICASGAKYPRQGTREATS